jgi:hypothetical protein
MAAGKERRAKVLGDRGGTRREQTLHSVLRHCVRSHIDEALEMLAWHITIEAH